LLDEDQYENTKSQFDDYCRTIATKDSFDDINGKHWWMNRRQSLDEEDVPNLHLFNVKGGSETTDFLNSFKCCRIESNFVGTQELRDRKRYIKSMKVYLGAKIKMAEVEVDKEYFDKTEFTESIIYPPSAAT